MDSMLPNSDPGSLHARRNLIIVFVSVGILVIVGVLVMLLRGVTHTGNQITNTTMTTSSTQASGQMQTAEQAGNILTGGHCSGSGSKTLTYAPMRPTDISIIEPYGLMTGAHVTPIDHEYYWGINQQTSYDVLAPADGTIVDIQNRTLNVGNKDIAVPVNQYRMVIAYSCTFISYVDLATSLSAAVKAKLPSSWDGQNHTGVVIPVTAGEVLGGVKGESLDFAVWDTTKVNPNLLVPVAYNNAEPWKIYTVPPLDYFSASVGAAIRPFYIRTAMPLDGTYAYDQEGKLVGSWFKVGTNGYLGATDPSKRGNYWAGHAAFVYNALVPSTIEISLGNFFGDQQGAQFGVVGNTPDPATITPSSGLVKYQLAQMSYIDAKGMQWMSTAKPNLPLTISLGAKEGTLLVQMEAAHKLKFEIFVGKTPAEVAGFDTQALEYNRGDDAVMPPSSAY